nr:arsenite efflux transporter metallochaperone ArsD [uncultured Prevotella sp.]
MKKIEIFDPAMCCSTGVCGPSVDKDLLRMATLIDTLKNMGIEIKRHNLSSEPQAFIQNTVIKELLEAKGTDILPATLVDGKVAVTGKYPSTAQMSQWTGKDLSIVPAHHPSDKNNGDGGGCCRGSCC